MSTFKFKLKLGDLVELNASGKNRLWLATARNSIGFVVGLYEPLNSWDWKRGAVIVRWANLAKPAYAWEPTLENKKIPVNCIKKVRRKKK